MTHSIAFCATLILYSGYIALIPRHEMSIRRMMFHFRLLGSICSEFVTQSISSMPMHDTLFDSLGISHSVHSYNDYSALLPRHEMSI